jgi:hypothetical protein
MSPVKSGQAYDLTPPEPPEWVSAIWNSSKSVVHLQWSTRNDVGCEVKRYSRSGDIYLTVSDLLAAVEHKDDEGIWLFEWQDEDVQSGEAYKYIIKGINDIRLSRESSVTEVET